jgi:hypothetical protein
VYLEVVAVNMRYSLERKVTENFLVVKLPSGNEVSVPVSEADVNALLQAPSQPAASNRDEAPMPNVLIDPSQPGPHMIAWMQVPDDILPPIVKAEFQRRGVPQMVSVVDAGTLAREIMDELGEKEAGIDEVEHDVRLPQSNGAGRRHVEADERGNPIVPGATVHTDEQDEETGVRSI